MTTPTDGPLSDDSPLIFCPHCDGSDLEITMPGPYTDEDIEYRCRECDEYFTERYSTFYDPAFM